MAGEASDLGNGSFVLPCGDEASLITCPDGWIGEAYDINNVWIYLEYESHYLDYYYMTDWTEDDFLDQVQSDIDELKDLDIFISSGDGPVYKGFTTKQVLGKDESYCYAWAPKGDGYLLVVLADYTAKPDFEAQILDAMALIAPYTGNFVEKAVATELGGGVFSLPCDEKNSSSPVPRAGPAKCTMSTTSGPITATVPSTETFSI